MLEATIDNLKQPIKIDISTGDVITPGAVEYSYPLMFEKRSISILSYNLETVLAEKLETVLSRAETNTRMRDYYDVYILQAEKGADINKLVLKAAFLATCKRRRSLETISNGSEILENIFNNETLRKQWENYRENSYYIGDVGWDEVVETLASLIKMIEKEKG